MLRRALSVFAVLAVALGVIAALPADQATAQTATVQDVDAFIEGDRLRVDVRLQPSDSEWAVIHVGRINADNAGDLGEANNTETGFFSVELGSPAPISVETVGTAPDRWDNSGFNNVEWFGPDLLTLLIDNGTDPFACGDTIAQLYLEVETLVGAPETLDLRDIPLPPCPVIADLEIGLGTAGYWYDESGDAFDFVGSTSTYEPFFTNEGPEDEPVTRYDYRVGTADTSFAVVGTDFTWTFDPLCSEFGGTGVDPTLICTLGLVAAGETVTTPVTVTWLEPDTYFTYTVMAFDSYRETIDPDGVAPEYREVEVVAPEGDFDGDGIANAIDRLGSVWSPLTTSASFDDGSTSGTITSGTASIADAPAAADGVVVTTTAAESVSIDACGESVSLSTDTQATITCGSIIVSVATGSATIELTDADGNVTTVELDAGDSVEADSESIEVTGGSVEVTEPDGTTTTVEEGDTYVPPVGDTDGDGVANVDDYCPATVFDSIIETDLKTRRYAWYGGEYFTAGSADAPMFSIYDTAGCSAEQIIAELGLGRGHDRFGLSLSAMRSWTDYVDSTG